jgi:hypothetical protein
MPLHNLTASLLRSQLPRVKQPIANTADIGLDGYYTDSTTTLVIKPALEHITIVAGRLVAILSSFLQMPFLYQGQASPPASS